MEDVTFWNTDSSPQGGRDWLLTCRISVTGQFMLGAFVAFQSLCRSRSGGILLDAEIIIEQTETVRKVLVGYARCFLPLRVSPQSAVPTSHSVTTYVVAALFSWSPVSVY